MSSDEEDSVGGIEEITVTAEKRTSTVSDTSMSITAFDSSLIEDLGLQGPDDLMDQLQLQINMMSGSECWEKLQSSRGDPVLQHYNGIFSPLVSSE